MYEDLYFTYLEINPLGMFVCAYLYFLKFYITFLCVDHFLCGIFILGQLKKYNMNKWHIFYLLVVTGDGLYILDMAAKIDATADYICKAKWGDVEFPPPFGREAYPEVTSVAFQIRIHQVERVWTCA